MVEIKFDKIRINSFLINPQASSSSSSSSSCIDHNRESVNPEKKTPSHQAIQFQIGQT